MAGMTQPAPAATAAFPVTTALTLQGLQAQPGAGWVPTPERFRDPLTRAIVRVWVDPADLSRHYVPETGG